MATYRLSYDPWIGRPKKWGPAPVPAPPVDKTTKALYVLGLFCQWCLEPRRFQLIQWVERPDPIKPNHKVREKKVIDSANHVPLEFVNKIDNEGGWLVDGTGDLGLIYPSPDKDGYTHTQHWGYHRTGGNSWLFDQIDPENQGVQTIRSSGRSIVKIRVRIPRHLLKEKRGKKCLKQSR